MEKQKFINLVKGQAQEDYKKSGILPSIVIAQAILESGWGDHAPGNNLFGIKWSEGCGHDKQMLNTSEYRNGGYEKVHQGMVENSFAYRISILTGQPYYDIITNLNSMIVELVTEYQQSFNNKWNLIFNINFDVHIK